MKKKTTVFLLVSLAFLVAFCVGVSAFLVGTMKQKGEQTISDIGELYMSDMSDEISMHFETNVRLRINHIKKITENNPSEADGSNMSEPEELLDEMEADGRIYDFESMAFISHDGTVQMIYGDEFKLSDNASFVNSLNKGDEKVAIAETNSGNKVVAIGIPASYSMNAGKESAGLMIGMPVEEIDSILTLPDKDALTYSYIIRRDGSFIIRNAQVTHDNYFDRVQEMFSGVNGKTGEEFVAEFQEAISKDEKYVTAFKLGEERRNLYCVHLPYSEWYLVTVLPYGELNDLIDTLNNQRMQMFLVSVFTILLVLIGIFLIYLRMMKRQVAKLEEARQEAMEANKAKSEFLSNMSHDIRTPMNAIVGMTAIAAANINSKKKVESCLKKITISSKHLLGLINDILDMSKIESGKMNLNIESFSLREILSNVANIMRPQMEAKHHSFDIYIHDIETENIFCDSVRLNQVIINLLSNAMKFTPPGGTIKVIMYQEPSELGDEYVLVHLRVIDNGIGMTKEFKDKIFESFAREDSKRVHRTEGTGLGMAITKYIVDAMNGTIEVESEPGKGTEFHIAINVERSFIDEEKMLLPDWNMLVVDDDRQMCESTLVFLREIGIRPEWTLDGETAISMVEERHRKHDDYHIILLDWKLPGIDGIETARRIRSKMGDDIPILLISAYDWSEIEDEARNAGVNGFIAKPLFKSSLFHELKQYDKTGCQKNVSQHEKEKEFSGVRLLVAEDNELNWEIVNELLAQEGLVMDHAEDGKICADMFNNSAEGYYKAILMDLRMPVMTGYEATEAIRSSERPDSDIPIIAMTADAFAEDIRKCLSCGMNAHISKPVDVNEVLRLLKRFIKDFDDVQQ